MGNILRGLCQCGFDTTEIFVGGGFTNFMHTCNAPAICLHCDELLVRNYVERNTARCPRCRNTVTFYDDPSVEGPWTETGGYDYLVSLRIADTGKFFKLADTEHLCPKCKNMTLIFEDKGRWD